jgi:small subunit ribosomal protein S2
MAVISMKTLFEAGVHFGHKTQKWHPKMEEYIYGAKAGIYIIDLRQTMKKLKEAYDYAYKISANGGSILFIGTKYTAQETIAEAAKKSGNYYVNLRWLGGMLTNFNTIKQSIGKLKKIEEMAGPDGTYPGIIKKEAVKADKQRKKLDAVLGGIREMRRMPAAVFIVDIRREFIAVEEAQKLGIPIIAIVDTNCDPRGIDYLIPGNDDSLHCIDLFSNVISTAAIQGKKAYESTVKVAKQESEKKRTASGRSTSAKRRNEQPKTKTAKKEQEKTTAKTVAETKEQGKAPAKVDTKPKEQKETAAKVEAKKEQGKAPAKVDTKPKEQKETAAKVEAKKEQEKAPVEVDTKPKEQEKTTAKPEADKKQEVAETKASQKVPTETAAKPEQVVAENKTVKPE